MSNKEERKAPVLRFKGFTDDWEQKELIDVLKQHITDGPHETPKIMKEGIPFISVEAIVNNKIDFKRKRGYISNEYNEKCNQKYKPQKNDVYLVKSGSTVGKTAIVETNIPFNIWSPLAALRPNNATSPYFLFYLLQTDNLQSQVINKSKGGTQPNLSMRLLEHFKIFVPNNIDYQTQIARLLINVDKIISLQQRKLDELIQIKEGIGQGLLNRHYRNLSIRFNQENSPWKQTKLGKIASFVNGRAFKQKELMNRGLYPVLRVGNFYTNNKWYYSNLNLSPDKYANKGDLLYTWSASFGPHVWKGPKVIYHYHIWKINFDPAVISKAYLYEFLKLDKKEILANSNGSTMIHITKKDMENKMITVPDMNEQIKIGKILEKLDLKIELNKNKLNNLKSVKQFLLQKMFM